MKTPRSNQQVIITPKGRVGQGVSPGRTTKKVQDYLIYMDDILGRGNFSQVYRGLNTVRNQTVAVKVVELSSLKTTTLINLLRSEIEILRTLNHPNVLRCYDIISSANNCYIVTELCNEGDLETLVLRTKGTLQQRDTRKMICDIYLGLRYLAEQNIIHRDVKVANIFMRDGVCKIADFGFAKRSKERFKDVNVGSPIYMPPEALLQSVYNPKTDIWAYGILIYELLHGDPPLAFCQAQHQLKANIAKPFNPAIIKPSVPDDLKDLIIRCLEIDENRRISAMEIQYHPYMQRIMRELGVQISPQPRPQSNQSNQSFRNLPPSAYMGQNSIRSTSNQSSQLRFQQKVVGQDRDLSNQMKNVRTFSGSKEQVVGVQGGRTSPSPSPSSRNIVMPPPRTNFVYGNTTQKVQFVQQRQAPPSAQRRSPSPPPRYVFQTPPSTQNLTPTRQNNLMPTPSSSRNVSAQELQRSSSNDLSTNGSANLLKFQMTDSSSMKIPTAIKYPSTGSTTASLSDPSGLTFEESLEFLHYCRLINKCVTLIKSNSRMSTLREIDYFTNWLLFMIEDLEVKSQTNLDYNNPRHVKLKSVVRQYVERYNKEYKRNDYIETSVNAVKSVVDMILQFLDNKIFVEPDSDQLQLVIIGQYMCFLQEANNTVKRCLETRDYSEILNCRIDQFLTTSSQNFNVKTYASAREKEKANNRNY